MSRRVARERVQLLRRFVAARGMSRLRVGWQGTVFEGVPLGQWVSYVRMLYAKRQLPPDVAHSLEAVPGWTWRAEQHVLPVGLEKFCARRRRRRPTAPAASDLVAVRHWVEYLRQKGRAGVPKWLVKEVERLPGWSW